MALVLPRDDTYAPRDGQRLGITSDWMFALLLCRNIALNRHSYRIVRECGDLNFLSRGRYVYLLERYSGELNHPMTLERVTPREVRLMNEIRPNSLLNRHCRPLDDYQLRAGLYEHFFLPAEQGESVDDPYGFSKSELCLLRIGRMTIWPSKNTRASILDKLNAKLTRPLLPEDPILGDWQRRCEQSTFMPPNCSTIAGDTPILSQFFLFDRHPPVKYDALCPLDGYVITIPAEYRTPSWTWSIKCGRHIKLRICPHCLRIMRDKLVALN